MHVVFPVHKLLQENDFFIIAKVFFCCSHAKNSWLFIINNIIVQWCTYTIDTALVTLSSSYTGVEFW